MDLKLQEIIREISKELNLDEELVKKVVKSEFGFVADVMRETAKSHADKTILLNYFGKFRVKKGRRKFLDNVNRE